MRPNQTDVIGLENLKFMPKLKRQKYISKLEENSLRFELLFVVLVSTEW